ncbi:MAG: type VI secretion system baseplate subunit TssK, partial [Acidobacteriota bacterium]|nr:type VI secretion system baseplate subunit TssK [Acidobacteriota bacterium]
SYTDETFTLAEFVPPLLRVPQSSPIGAMASSIAKRLREKAVFLADRARSPAIAGRPPQLLETKAMIHSLVAALPQFEAVLTTGMSHPFSLYLSLTTLVGQVAAVGRGMVPPVLEPYDHNDLYACFERCRQFIFRLIDEGILESYTGFSFYLEQGMWNLAFDEGWRGRSLVLGLRGQPGAAEREVVAWMEQCLIGSKANVESMRERRILGARRRRIEGDGDLVPASGVVLFALEADPEFVLGNQLLQVWNSADRGGASGAAELILYVKNRR